MQFQLLLLLQCLQSQLFNCGRFSCQINDCQSHASFSCLVIGWRTSDSSSRHSGNAIRHVEGQEKMALLIFYGFNLKDEIEKSCLV
jgi:hypothetical protein